MTQLLQVKDKFLDFHWAKGLQEWCLKSNKGLASSTSRAELKVFLLVSVECGRS